MIFVKEKAFRFAVSSNKGIALICRLQISKSLTLTISDIPITTVFLFSSIQYQFFSLFQLRSKMVDKITRINRQKTINK